MTTRPPNRPTPAGKQRVRTGCQTCRRRRRKCDERKPRCEACELKGFQCKYGADLTFVIQNKFVVEPAVKQAFPAPQAAAFMESRNGRPALAPSAGSSDARNLTILPPNADVPRNLGQGASAKTGDHQDGTIDERTEEESSRSYIVGAASHPFRDDSFAYEPQRGLSPMSLSGMARSQSGPAVAPTFQRTLRPATTPSLTYAYPSPLARRDPDAMHETGLLSHYRYHVAPWVDIAGPESTFGIGVLMLARDRDSRALFAAIFALAAGHLSTQNQPGLSDEAAHWSALRCRYRQEAELGLRYAEEQIRRVGISLLLVDNLFCSNPNSWQSLLLNHMSIPGIVPNFAKSTEEADEAVFWLYLRIDLAASISSSQPPLIPYASYIREDGSLRSGHPSPDARDVQKLAFQHALTLLASALTLVHSGYQEPPPQNEDYIDAGTFASSRQPSLSSRWTSLWTSCQRWYANRSIEVEQILEIRGSDVDLIDPSNASAFPILVYTTPLALVANAVYHITSLLLLIHRPRLLKPLAGPRCLTSCIWHAQSIAGITVSNDSAEQWDPILISGLLLAAKDMTHVSQQSAVLERLGRITECTGIRLDHEAEELKSMWSVAAYNEMEGM